MSVASLSFATAPVHADTEALRGKLKLSHVSASLWRVDYQFNQPIEGLRFRQIGEYRAQAWKPDGKLESAYQRPLLSPILMTVALSELESQGMSIKGGASQGQINFRVSGKQSVIDSPALRDAFGQLIAHEIAHIWQNNLPHEAIGEDAPWIHEGGAEAMSLDAMYASGLWDKDKLLAMQTKRWNECDKLANTGVDLATNYRAHYVCGMKRFDDSKLNIVTIWRALIAESERSGKVYSEQMVRDIFAQLQRR